MIITEETGRRIAESLERLEVALRVFQPPARSFPFNRCRYCNAPNGHGGLPCPEMAGKTIST